MMTRRLSRHSHFADVLGEEQDPAVLRVAVKLDRLYKDTLPPDRDAAIRSRLRERMAAASDRPTQARPRLLAWSRRSLLIAAAALSLAVAGAAYAGGSLIDRLFALFVNHTQQSIWHNQGTDLNLSQTACGRTMTIRHVYADANRIIVGYTLSGSGPAITPRLTDASGIPFPVLDGGGTSSGPQANVSANIITFDSSHIAGQPNHLALHLIAPWVGAPGSAPCPRALVFRFTVPFRAGQPLDLHQTVVSEGVAVTLDRVVISPIEIKVYVHTVAKPVNAPYLADLTVNGRALENGFAGWTSQDGRDIFSFKPAPYEPGEATLTLSWPNSVLSAATKRRPTSGPWTFRFMLP